MRGERMEAGLVLTAALLLLSLAVGAAPAAVEVSERPVPEAEGGVRLQVKNEYFTLEFNPLGGYACSFRTRYSDRDWLWPGSALVDSGHLFLENWLGDGYYPNELTFLKREHEIVERGPDVVVLKFSAITKDKFLVEKTFTIRAGSPAVRCDLAMTNQSPETVTKGLWPKTDLHISGIKERNYYYRPYQHGVLVTGWNEEQKTNLGEDFLRTPAQGWTAALQADEREGLVWLMDYNWLRTLYNCHSCWTVEWFYDDLPLTPGYRWATSYDMILVKGFDNISHASATLIAGTTMEAKKAFDLVNPDNPDRPDLVQITHTLSRSTLGDLADVQITCELVEVDNAVTHPLPPLSVARLTWEPVELTHSVQCNPDIRLVCKVNLTATGPQGEAVAEAYEYYWPGVSGEKFNLVAGGLAPTYYRQPPRKTKEFPKPEGIKYVRNVPTRALEFRGPGYSKLRLMEAAARAGIGEYIASYFTFDLFGGKCDRVPTSYPEMHSYDLVILNGVNAQSLTEFGQIAIRDFVEAGGAALVTGGFFSYGPGQFVGTPIAEFLPVRLTGKPFDLEQFSPPAPVRTTSQSRLLANARWAREPLCYWRHRLGPQPGAWVELAAGDKPLLVCGTFGAGRVAALCSAAFGDPASGEMPYWEDPAWVENMARVMRWLVYPDVK